MPTTTSQNTRIFAPQVYLTQDTTRLMIKLKSGEGYTIPSGLTLGDVIRYDPQTIGYTLSSANNEQNAEVVGVIESISSGEYVVITSGSVKYPTTRLSKITSGGGGGVDVLFLDELSPGGLTGTIDLAGSSDKIVKPVLQVAPHSVYNGIVLNYVGYKTGNQAVSQEDTPILPVGSIMYSSPSINPGNNWIKVDTDRLIFKDQYTDLYSIYDKTSGDWVEKITLSTGTASSTMIGKTAQSKSGGSIITSGTVVGVDTTTNSVLVRKNKTTDQITITHSFFVDINSFGVSSTNVYQFTVPAVSSTVLPVQGSITLVPYIKAYEIVAVKIPESITVAALNVNNNATITGNVEIGGTLKAGSLTNITQEIINIKNRLNAAGIP